MTPSKLCQKVFYALEEFDKKFNQFYQCGHNGLVLKYGSNHFMIDIKKCKWSCRFCIPNTTMGNEAHKYGNCKICGTRYDETGEILGNLRNNKVAHWEVIE